MCSKAICYIAELGGVLKKSPSKVFALDDVHENSAKVIRCTATNRFWRQSLSADRHLFDQKVGAFRTKVR